MSDDQLAVTLTVADLRGLVKEAALSAVADAVSKSAPEVLNLTQAAELLQRHPKIISQLVRTEGLPAHYISSKEPRFRRSELLAWLATRPTQPIVTELK